MFLPFTGSGPYVVIDNRARKSPDILEASSNDGNCKLKDDAYSYNCAIMFCFCLLIGCLVSPNLSFYNPHFRGK